MWQEIESVVPDASVLRRLLFAAIHVSKECPKYWDIVTEFAYGSAGCNKDDVRVLLDNLEFLEDKAFPTDKELLKELCSTEGYDGQLLGIVLISSNCTCRSCGGKLLIRADRPSFMTIYTDDMGTVHGTHFRKYCQNSRKKCQFTQHYGFHAEGDKSDMFYDPDWDSLPYFISTSKTAFSLSFLKRFEAELLLGQVSFNQKSSIYNYYNNYEQVKKKTLVESNNSDDDDHTEKR